MIRPAAFLCMVLLSFATGCADSPEFSTQQQRVIDAPSREDILTQAAQILRREFGRVTIDSNLGRITSAPVEFTTQHDSSSARDIVGVRSVLRRYATFNVFRRGELLVAGVRVDVERQDLERASAAQPASNRLGDTPGNESPIDRDAATTARQNAVWTKIRRDYRMERAILDELREHFAPAAPASAPAPAPAPVE